MDKIKSNNIDTTLYNEKSLYLLNIRELRDIGRKFGVPSPTTLKKQELIDYILKIVYGEIKAPARSNYGRPNVREFNMTHYIDKIKKNSELTDELLKIKLDNDFFAIGELKLASPKEKAPINNIENRVFIEENDKCYLRVHGFVESEKDIEISKEYAEKLKLENFDVIEARIEDNMCKIITINGVGVDDTIVEFVVDSKPINSGQKQVFYVRTKEEIEEKINEIIENSEKHDLKLLIFANKKYTRKCTEYIEYDINNGYPKMYKDFMTFVNLCQKYVYKGETIVVLLESISDIEDMCDHFDTDIGDRIRTNIKQMFDKIVALQNFYVTFRIETSRLY